MAEKDVLAGEKAILETVIKNAKAIANIQQTLDAVLKNQAKMLALLDKSAPRNQRLP